MTVEGPSPRRSQPPQVAHGPNCGVPRDQLQSGMLLERHGQESSCCLIQEPAEFPSVGLDKGGREQAVLLVLQNALREEGMIVRTGCTPGAPQSSQAPHGLSYSLDVMSLFQLSQLKTAGKVPSFLSSVTIIWVWHNFSAKTRESLFRFTYGHVCSNKPLLVDTEI